MYYRKILEVKEDLERVYFSFFTDVNEMKIIGVPKKTSSNQGVYAGTSYSSLNLVDSKRAGLLLDAMMKRTIQLHPAFGLCSKDVLMLHE